MNAYPIKDETVRSAVRVFTFRTRIVVPAIIKINANILAFSVVMFPCGNGLSDVLAIFASIFLSIIWLMVAAEDAHSPMPNNDMTINDRGGKVLDANNIPTIAVINIIITTFGLVSSK